MKIKYFIATLTAICILLMVFNKKARIFKIFLEQVGVFKNDRTGKTSFLDILSFIVCPTALSLIITIYYGFVIEQELAEILTTAFSLVFTLLFAFEAILVGKKEDENETMREVIKQTFISIVTASIFALLASILSITIMFVNVCWITKLLTILILMLSFITVMLLLMIIKRTFNV